MPGETPAGQPKPLHSYPSLRGTTKLFSYYGVDSTRYNNIHWLSGDTVVTTAGRFILFIDIKTASVDSITLENDHEGGVGTVAVHPSRSYFVVGERCGSDPELKVYGWPSKKHVYTMKGGAAVGFSACAFSVDGERLASVGSFPDYTLSLWNWESKSMILRSKCFSSDIYNIRFSPFDPSILVSCGVSHIKFWTTAQTFTGLKLQGLLGKFGRLEISNISGFVILEDGKIISGSENGCLLVWEGDTVKCSMVESYDKGFNEGGAVMAQRSYPFQPCHRGPINIVELIHDNTIVVSAGDDGYMRYWNLEELSNAEGEGFPPLYAPRCLLKVFLGEKVRIRSMTHSVTDGTWVVMDSYGQILRTPYPAANVFTEEATETPVFDKHLISQYTGGGIASSIISTHDHVILTGGEDGSIRLTDYVSGTELIAMKFPEESPVVSMVLLDSNPSDLFFTAGFEEGTLRLFRCTSRIELLGQWKPHEKGLKGVATDAARKYLSTMSDIDGTVFFFSLQESAPFLRPLGYCKIPLRSTPLCIEWDEEVGGCLIGFETGQVLSIKAPGPNEVNHSVSFEFTPTFALLGLRQRLVPPPKPEDEEDIEKEDKNLLQEEDNGPWATTIIRRLPDGTLAIGVRQSELIYQYTGCVRYPNALSLPPLPATGIEPPNYVEEPLMNLCYRDFLPLSAYVSGTKKHLAVACEGSKVIIRGGSDYATLTLACPSHDNTTGHITGAFVSFDEAFVVTTGTDGLIVTHLRDGFSAPSKAQTKRSFLPTLHSSEFQAPTPIPLSIQQQKEADDVEAQKRREKEKLDLFMDELNRIHEQYAPLVIENELLAATDAVSKQELYLHPSIPIRLEKEKEKIVSQVKKQYEVEVTRERLRTEKLRACFIGNLEQDHISVRSFSNQFEVPSLRTLHLRECVDYFYREIDALGSGSDTDNDEATDSDTARQEEFDENANENKEGREGNGDREALLSDSEGREDGISLGGAMQASVQQQLKKMEARKRERQERRQAYDALLGRKPNAADDATQLAEKIKEAEDRRGDCTLRTDPKYMGAYEFRPSVVAKLQRMIKIETILYEKKRAFNAKVLAMRERKRQNCDGINTIRQRIEAINLELKDDTMGGQKITLESTDNYEKANQIDRTGLDAYAKEKEEENEREERAKKAQRGFGADLAGATSKESVGSRVSFGGPKRSTPKGSTVHKATRSSRQSIAFANAANRERGDQELRARLDNVKLSEIEEEENELKRRLLLSERHCLVHAEEAIRKNFDQELLPLLFERASLDGDICQAESQLLVLFEEYQLLLVFRQRDRELRAQLRSAKSVRESLRKEIHAIKKVLSAQEKEIALTQESLKVSRAEAEEYITDNAPDETHSYLLKIYNRYIKRHRENEDEDDDDDITSDDDEEEFQEDDIIEEICPSTCPIEVWTEVLALRNTRLDFVDKITDGKGKLEQAKKRYAGTERTIDEQLKKVNDLKQEISDLQAEKRRQLNLLETTVVLRCNQIKCLTKDGFLPSHFQGEPIMLISEDQIHQLRRRIEALAREKDEKRHILTEMACTYRDLQLRKKDVLTRQTDWESRVHDVMLLKFGQCVDLDALESCGTTRRVESKKEDLRRLELHWQRAIHQLENDIASVRDALQEALVQNTNLLQNMGDGEQNRQELEHLLAHATLKVVQRHRGPIVATKKDRQNLKDLIAAQQVEIDALKAEIFMLRRKGGHVYSTTGLTA